MANIILILILWVIAMMVVDMFEASAQSGSKPLGVSKKEVTSTISSCKPKCRVIPLTKKYRNPVNNKTIAKNLVQRHLCRGSCKDGP